ncbi:MCE family protein [Actinocorallia longicatena]|uniref:Phospholipid/cholesterol/gamma-HCH transport system substrate-binding protein n=1 Tax=Actinocorallia longicatena TaxID=111803 RepID=A0ABP6QH07_9ACTN
MRTLLRLAVPLLVVVMAVAAVVLLWPSAPQHRLTAYFTNTVGLYPGADVRILGIPVGKVDSIHPAGTAVRVEMHYESRRKVPADAQAVIVAQSLVSDRFVQLTPVYTGGAVLQDRATIDVKRTAVPVEVDEVSQSLNDLNKALGPDGANKDGALSRFLEVGAANLDGTGDDLRKTIGDSADVLATLSDNREDITASLKNLEQLTEVLAANDDDVRRFTDSLSAVTTQLNGEKDELSAALKILGPTLQNVTRFVKDNKGSISKSVSDLASATAVLVKQKKAFGEFLNTAPLGIANMARAYDPISGTLHTRTDFLQFKNPADWICSLAYSLGTPPKECLKSLAPLSGGLGFDLKFDLSWITALTTTYNPHPVPCDAYGPGDKRKPAACKGGGKNKKVAGEDKPDKTLGGLLPDGGGQ